MSEEINKISFQIIANVGEAKGYFIESLSSSKSGDMEKARQLIKKGEMLFNQGHIQHGKLLSRFASGEEIPVDVLLVHAECQMMSAEDFKIIAEQFLNREEE